MRGRRIWSWPGARAWRLMLLLALIGMALSSLGGAIVAGQANPPITQEEADQADQPALETAEPSVTPPDTGEATMPPVEPDPGPGGQQVNQPPVEPDPGPGGQQVNQPPIGRDPDQPPFVLELIKRVCPSKEGFIPESATFAELDDACRLEVADPANFFFIVTDATGEQRVINGIGALLELPTGRTRAQERHAGDYGDPIVWCSFGKGEPPVRMRVAERGVTLDPEPDMLVTCVFFNPELPPGPEASLTIHKRLCADGYDPTTEKVDPIVDCTEPLDKVPFALADDDPATPDRQQVTGEVIESGVVFEGLAGGRYVVTETPPEGVTGAVVWTCEIDGRSVDADAPPLSVGFELELEIPDGANVVCFWFNLRGGEPEPGDDGSITVVKVACPPGYDPAARGADPAADCGRPMDDVGFALIPADPEVDPRKGRTGDDGRGTLTFEGLPAGGYVIEENLPEGFAQAVVWACTDDPRQPRALDGPLAEGTRLEVDLAAGQDLWCLWLNIAEGRPAEPTQPPVPTEVPTPTPEPTEPVGNGSSLILYKWECPEGTSSEQDVTWYTEHCQLGMLEIVFELTTAGGTVVATSQPNGLHFDDLPAGTLSLREVIPDGYGAPRVFCAFDEASLPTAVPVVDGAIQIDIGADDTLVLCYWYNIPAASEEPEPLPTESAFVIDPTVSGTSTIRLETPTPPPAEVATIAATERPGAGSGAGDLAVIVIDADGQPIGGACIALIDANGDVVAESCDTEEWEQEAFAGNGVTGFFGVPAGEYTVRLVSVPGGGDAGDVVATVTSGGSAQVEMTVGTPAPEPTLPMPWTPTPAPDRPQGGDGSITVVKVTCPAGFDVDRDHPARECTKQTDGVSFTITGEDGESQRGRTGDDGRGRVVFDSLPAGNYEIVEAAQDGTEPVVWACVASLRDLATADGPLAEGGSVTVDLSAGEGLICLWLNVPASGESAAVVLTPVVAVPMVPVLLDDPEGNGPQVAGPDMPGGVDPPERVPGAPQLDLPVTGEVHVNAYTCPDTFRIPSYQSVHAYRTDCTSPLAVNFRLGQPREDGSWHELGWPTDSEGAVTWRNLDLGQVSITQDKVSGYAMPQVFCRNPESSTWTHMPIDWGWTGFYHHIIYSELDADSPALECEWYNVPLNELDRDRRIGIIRHYCLNPDMTQPLDEQCGSDAGHPFTYRVSTSDLTPEFSTTESTAFLVNATPVRALTITQQLPEGYNPPVAKCRVVDYNQRWRTVSDLGWLEADAEGSIAFDPIGIDNALDCHWYSIVHAPDLATETPAAGSGSITIAKGTCPDGFDIDAPDADPLRACGKLRDGVTFTLTPGDGGTSQRGRTGDDGRGMLSFDDLAPGSYEIAEAMPAGSTDSFVWYCTDDLRARQAPKSPLSRGTTLELELAENQALTCFWFNVGDGGESAAVVVTPVVLVPSVLIPLDEDAFRISAFACDSGYAHSNYRSASLDALRTMCSQPFADLPMRVGGNDAEWRATDASGRLRFAELDAGAVEVRQEPRSGYQWPIVFCGDADGTLQKVGSLYFVRTVEIAAEPASTVCEWFVVPLTDDFHTSRIELASHTCDADQLGPGGMPGPACDLGPVNTLSITGDQGWEYSFQNENGLARQHRAPTDEALTISVVDQAGLDRDAARVSCVVVDWADRTTVVRDLEWYEVSGDGTVTVPAIGTNNAMQCAWYDIFTTPRGTMKLYGYDCPVAAFTDLPGCAKATIWFFDLQIRDDGDWRSVSRRSVSYAGTWDMPNLRPGTYRLVPTSDAWCHVWTDRPADGGTFAIVAGEETTVRAYRCTGD